MHRPKGRWTRQTKVCTTICPEFELIKKAGAQPASKKSPWLKNIFILVKVVSSEWSIYLQLTTHH